MTGRLGVRLACAGLAVIAGFCPPAVSAVSFEPATTITVFGPEDPVRIGSATVADLNSDGRMDVAMLLYSNVFQPHADHFRINLYEQGADGVLRLERSLPVFKDGKQQFETRVIHAADLDADGVPELVLTNRYEVVIMAREADGDYGERTRMTLPKLAELAAGMVHVDDVDGDGHMDLILHANTSLFYLFRGKGDATFSPPTFVLSYGSTDPGDMAVADLDGDGRQDLLALRSEGLSELAVSWGDDSPQGFSAMWPIDFGEDRPVSVAAGDFDGNGRQDIAYSYIDSEYPPGTGVVYHHHAIALREVGPDRSIGPARTFRTGFDNLSFTASEGNLIAIDLDGNGRTELVSYTNGLEVIDWSGGAPSVQLLPKPDPSSGQSRGENLFVADFNGDGCLDVATANQFYFHVYPATCEAAPASTPAPPRRIRVKEAPRPATPAPGMRRERAEQLR